MTIVTDTLESMVKGVLLSETSVVKTRQAQQKDFYDTAAHGGIEGAMDNGKGYVTKMKDGTILSYRETSSSDGSPAVEINIKQSDEHGDIKYQKIHFVKGE